MLWLLAVAALSDVEAEIANLEPQVRLLLDQYTKTEALERKAGVDARITDGEILFLLGDYVRAGIVLYDIIEDKRNEVHPQFDLALYYLAESSFHTRNFLGARSAFSRLLQRGKSDRSADAFARLVEISDLLSDYAGVEAHAARMAKPLRPDVAYFYGKSLVRRATLGAQAITQLLSVPSDHKYYGRARYAVAVVLIQQGRFDEAIVELKRVLALQDPLGLGADKDDVTRLRELCLLAIARVHGEQGRLGDALGAYLSIDRRSPLLPQMLYEMAWLYVSAGELRKGLQSIELFLLTVGDDPSAHLLKANVLLKLGRFTEAAEAFRNVNRVYEPVLKQLDVMLKGRPDPEGYFNELIAKSHGTYNARAFLPPLAVGWATGEREVAQALSVASDLVLANASVLEARAVGKTLRAALAAMQPVDLFPVLREGRQKARVIATRLMTLLSQLLPATPRRLAAERAMLALRERDERRSQIEEARQRLLAELELNVMRLRVDIQNVRAQLIALGTWLAKMPSSQPGAEVALQAPPPKLVAPPPKLVPPPPKLVAPPKRVARGKKPLSKLERMLADAAGGKPTTVTGKPARTRGGQRPLSKLERMLAASRANQSPPTPPEATVEPSSAPTTPSIRVDLSTLRDELAAQLDELLTLEAEHKALFNAIATERLLGAPTSNDAKVAAEYAAAVKQDLGSLAPRTRDQLAYMHATLQQFDRKVAQLAERKVADLGLSIETEMRLLDRYETELRVWDAQAKTLVGKVAKSAFDDVKHKFYALVLKADVGLIDVAWRQKEEETDDINALVKAQKEELEALDLRFGEALRE